ncbi:MAG: polyprenyl synthetase family protein [Erysipelotrichaceae bacterium]
MLNQFENYLLAVTKQWPNCETSEAMKYMLLQSGKRVRPSLLFALVKDQKVSEDDVLKCACCIEMIHTYSLIHDDLPAMDDDTMRRGLPTCHKAYNEAVAILAGDALLTYAFYLASTIEDGNISSQIVQILGRNSGIDGMILGQDHDMNIEKYYSIEDIKYTQILKTGCLFNASLQMGLVLLNATKYQKVMEEIAYNLGLLFQFQDDLLDVLADPLLRGKSASDLQNEKNTLLKYYDIDQLKGEINKLNFDINESISSMDLDLTNLRTYINSLIDRKR